jgi:hypothetical protein
MMNPIIPYMIGKEMIAPPPNRYDIPLIGTSESIPGPNRLLVIQKIPAMTIPAISPINTQMSPYTFAHDKGSIRFKIMAFAALVQRKLSQR